MDEGYDGKLRLLAQEVALHLITPETRRFSHGASAHFIPRESSYQVHTYRPVYIPPGRLGCTGWILDSKDLDLRNLQPDIIHIENERHGNIVLQSLLYRRLLAPRARVIVFFWANQQAGGVKGAIIDALNRLVSAEIDFYIAGNRDGKRLAVASGIDPARLAIIPQLGVDVQKFAPIEEAERLALRRRVETHDSEFVVGFVGRFVAEKGIHDLFSGVKQIRQQADSGRPVRLLLLGTGPLLDTVHSWQSAHSFVTVVPPNKYEDVAPYIQMLDVLVLPSKTTHFWKEQFGHVLIEAMACGVPVIGSDSGAIPEVIGDAGLVFSEGNVDHLCDCLLRLYRNQELCSKLAYAGRRQVLSYYSDERIAQRTLDAYEWVLSNQ